MKRLIVLAFLLALPWGMAHASCPEDLPGILKGVASDQWTGEALDGVAVSVSGPSGSTSTSTSRSKGVPGYYEVRLPAGTYTASFSRQGYGAQSRSVALSCGVITRLNLPMAPEAGSIAVDSNPQGAEIYLDGTRTGNNTPATLAVRVGNHTLAVTKEGYLDPSPQTVAVAKDGTTTATFNFIPLLRALTLTQDKLADEVEVNTEAFYTLNLTNAGNVADAYALAIANPQNATAALSTSTAALEPGASLLVTLRVGSSAPGNYTIQVLATSQADGTKVANITATTTVFIPLLRALTLTQDKLADEVEVNTEAFYTLNLTNAGNVADAYALAIANPQNATAALSTSTAALEPGASLLVTLRVGSSAPGNYTIQVLATSQADGTKVANITATTAFFRPVLYGTFLTANKLSDKAYLGKEATYTLVLKNTGRERDTFTLSLVNHDGSKATLTAAALELNPQASGTFHLYVGAEKPGVYRVEVIANSRGDATKASSLTTMTRIEEKTAAPPATVLTLALLREIASRELKGKEFYRADTNLYGPLATVNEYPEPAGEARALEGDVYVIASTRISSKYQKADTIVVARGDLPVDSAAAVPYARLLGAPILLTRPGDLPRSTLAALERLGPKRIVVVGGPQAVSEGVVSDLQRLAPVERKAGGTRVETALALAREVKGPTLFVVATGKSPLDTTIASAAYNAPVLYVEAGRVPGGVKEYLREHRGARVLFAPDVPRNIRAEVEGLLNP